MKRGTFYTEDAQTVQSAAGPSDIITKSIDKEGKYLGIAIGLTIFGIILIGLVIYRYNYSKQKAMTKYVNEALANEYGATTELSEIRI